MPVSTTAMFSGVPARLSDGSPLPYVINQQPGGEKFSAYGTAAAYQDAHLPGTDWSLHFDGQAGFFRADPSTAFDPGVDDFCIDFWLKLDALPIAGDTWPGNWSAHQCLYSHGYPGSATGFGIVIGQNNIFFNNNDSQAAAGPHMLEVGVFSHIAVTRAAGVLRTFTKGVKRGEQSGITTNFSYATAGAFLGCETGEGAFTKGDIQLFRIRKGVAVWTSDFTPSPADFTITEPAVLVMQPRRPRARYSPAGGLPALKSTKTAKQNTWNMVCGGLGVIAGTVKEKASPANLPLVRRVSLFTQKNKMLVGTTVSDANGNYIFRNLDTRLKYYTTSHDPSGSYNGVIADHLTPTST